MYKIKIAGKEIEVINSYFGIRNIVADLHEKAKSNPEIEKNADDQYIEIIWRLIKQPRFFKTFKSVDHLKKILTMHDMIRIREDVNRILSFQEPISDVEFEDLLKSLKKTQEGESKKK